MKRPRNRTLPLKFEPLVKIVALQYPDNIEKRGCLEYCGSYWENLLDDFFRKWECVCEIDTNVGMSADAIRVSFKYDTPDELIKEICNQAIQMMQVATTPMFKVGQSALFKTTQSDLLQYNDCEVIVKRLLTEEECDIDYVGFMYEVTTNGETFQAYQDELS